MELREIIIVLGLIAIGVIVWDGIRRMKSPADKTRNEPFLDPEEAARRAQIARELPNGGARVREMTVEEKVDLKSKLNFRERVPMLMERVDVGPVKEEEPEAETQIQVELDFSQAMSDPVDDVSDKPEVEKAPVTETDDPVPLSEPEEVTAPVMDETAQPPEERPAPAVKKPPAASAEPEEASEPIDVGPVEDLVIIHVMAPEGQELSGSAVLDLLVTAGLRHGPMDIFHYRNPKGITEFSLANCVRPGTFDPDAMNQLNTPGVTLFMQLPTAADAMEAFDHMYEMAVFLAKHLDAQILDEGHSTVTPQRIEYYREKLRSFARTKLLSPH